MAKDAVVDAFMSFSKTIIPVSAEVQAIVLEHIRLPSTNKTFS